MRTTTRTPSRETSPAALAVSPVALAPRSFGRRLRTVLAAALALAALTAGPASAQVNGFAPGGSGPDDEEEPPILIPIPLDEPSISLDLTPTCGDTPGVQYVIDVLNPYPGQHLYELHWAVSQPLLFPNTIHSQAGFVPTGEGAFAFRADAENLGQLGWSGSTDWTVVTVECDDEEDPNPEDPDEEDPDEDPEVGPDDEDIVVGNPNFTG
jgi:hypothetical protein